MKDKAIGIYRRLFHTRTIFTQLVLFTAVVSVVPIIFISSMLFQKISSMVTDELVASHRQLVAQYKSNIENKFYQYRVSLEQISNNTVILNNLLGKVEETNPYIKGGSISVEVNKSLIRDSREIPNCMIYSDLETQEVYGYRVAM